ncbi:hypothetical protein CF392_08735 [Tamilnaduibacter salinus]|uniref:Nucleoside-diphosphate sugar epimerase n=1 Tax=Tamilnaduibacter salinus TaxID=1484056 RepID=A0A2A2I2B6_9GAMM|nr:mitochondrial fission ELM1 family protein [Tamilnaduibacter salinus]PAV25869.1 hypothetical protein CF392_08735 [Tamilnaduibacter salinus]
MVTTPSTTDHTSAVWLLADNRPGHRRQLQGLGNRLKVLAGADVHWLDVNRYPVPLWRALTGLAPRWPQTPPAPDLVIGAGHQTHRALLALRRRCRTVVLMKPSFPLSLVDAAIIPEHDGVRPAAHRLITEGVLHPITPMARLTNKPQALMLIGGPSRHVRWQDEDVLAQARQLIDAHPRWHWTISDSRRTPEELTQRLQALSGPRVTVVDHSQTHDQWVSHTLATSRAVWVTPDSVSMVCEAVTSGVPTGVLDVPLSPGSRLAHGIDQLLARERIVGLDQQSRIFSPPSGQTPVRSPLWEADRAARWLIKRGLGP